MTESNKKIGQSYAEKREVARQKAADTKPADLSFIELNPVTGLGSEETTKLVHNVMLEIYRQTRTLLDGRPEWSESNNLGYDRAMGRIEGRISGLQQVLSMLGQSEAGKDAKLKAEVDAQLRAEGENDTSQLKHRQRYLRGEEYQEKTRREERLREQERYNR